MDWSAAVAQHQLETEIDAARAFARQYQPRRGTADGVAMYADGRQARRNQPAHFEVAQTDDGDRLFRGRALAQQAGLAQARHEADGMRIVRCKHRVDTGQFCKGEYDENFFIDGFKGAPLNSVVLHSGDVFGIMMSTPARGYPDGKSLDERSNVVLMVW